MINRIDRDFAVDFRCIHKGCTLPVILIEEQPYQPGRFDAWCHTHTPDEFRREKRPTYHDEKTGYGWAFVEGLSLPLSQ